MKPVTGNVAGDVITPWCVYNGLFLRFFIRNLFLPVLSLMEARARLLALALLSCVPAPGSSRRDVLELTDADFDYLSAEHETLLVTFYAPW